MFFVITAHGKTSSIRFSKINGFDIFGENVGANIDEIENSVIFESVADEQVRKIFVRELMNRIASEPNTPLYPVQVLQWVKDTITGLQAAITQANESLIKTEEWVPEANERDKPGAERALVRAKSWVEECKFEYAKFITVHF